MFNRAFVFLSSTFIFLFPNKRNFFFVFVVYVYIASIPHRAPLLLHGRVWNVSYRIQRVRIFPSEWILLPCSVWAFTPNNGTDKWRSLKSLLKMTWPILHLILAQQTTMLGLCHSSVFEWYSQFCNPSRHLTFIASLLTPFPLCVLSLRPPPALIPVHESGQQKW